MHDDIVGQLLDTAAGRLAAYGFLLTGSRRAGDELVRDAITRVFVRRRLLRDVRAAEGHVRAAMRAIHLAAVRRSSSRRADPPAPPRVPGDDDPPIAARNPTARALAELSPHERAVVILRHHDDLTIPEIAGAMRISESAAEHHLSRALAVLTRVLGDIEPVSDHVLVIDRTRK